MRSSFVFSLGALLISLTSSEAAVSDLRCFWSKDLAAKPAHFFEESSDSIRSRLTAFVEVSSQEDGAFRPATLIYPRGEKLHRPQVRRVKISHVVTQEQASSVVVAHSGQEAFTLEIFNQEPQADGTYRGLLRIPDLELQMKMNCLFKSLQ